MRPSTGCLTAIEVTLRMRPKRRSFMPGRTARVISITESRVRRTVASQAASSWLSKGPEGGPPALVTRMSTRPCSRIAASATRRASSGFETSAATAVTRTPDRAAISSRAASSAASPARAQRERGALRGQLLGDGAPQPLARARHQRDLPPQAEVHATSAAGSRPSRRASPGAAGQKTSRSSVSSSASALCGRFDGMTRTSPARSTSSSPGSSPSQKRSAPSRT